MKIPNAVTLTLNAIIIAKSSFLQGVNLGFARMVTIPGYPNVETLVGSYQSWSF